MTPGDVVLIALPQFAGGPPKLRPALFLATRPGPYQTALICGISTQLNQQRPNWDELIEPADDDFVASGLHRASVIRLSYLYGTDPSEFAGAIGQINAVRLVRLRERLSDLLRR
jgi:hypothetical protein